MGATTVLGVLRLRRVLGLSGVDVAVALGVCSTGGGTGLSEGGLAGVRVRAGVSVFVALFGIEESRRAGVRGDGAGVRGAGIVLGVVGVATCVGSTSTTIASDVSVRRRLLGCLDSGDSALSNVNSVNVCANIDIGV